MAAPECDRFGADLSAYLDGELADRRAREIERHLLGCQSCRRTVAELRAAAQGLAELPHLSAPPELARLIRHAAERQRPAPARPPAPLTRRAWKLYARLSASAALVAACVLAGWYAYRQGASPRTAAPGTLARPAGNRASPRLAVRETHPPAGARRLPAPLPEETAVGRGEFTRSLRPPESQAEPAAAPAGQAHEVAQLGVAARSSAAVPPPAGGAGATIDVFVAPQNLEQERLVRTTLADLQAAAAAPHEAGRRGVLAAGADDAERCLLPASRRGGRPDRPVGHAYAFQLPPARAAAVIDQLEQQAPKQVFVRWADLPHVQYLPQAALITAEMPRDLRRRSAGRPAEPAPRAGVVLNAAPDRGLAPAPAGKRTPVAAGNADAETGFGRRRAAARGVALARRLPARAAAGGPRGRSAEPAAASAGAAGGPPASRPAPAGVAAQPTPRTPPPRWAALARELGARLGRAAGDLLRAARARPEPPGRVTVRVTLLPLSASQAAPPAERTGGAP